MKQGAISFPEARAMWARIGMRTVVVVDTPCVHQLVEAYVSKLYSQAFYGELARVLDVLF